MYAFVAVALFLTQAASEPRATEHPASSEEVLSVLERAATAVSGPRPEDAQPHIQWLLEEASEVPVTHELAGRYHLARRQYHDAEQALSRALKLGVEGLERARVLALLGTAQLHNGRNLEAEVSLSKALRENPDERTALLHSAVLMLNQRNFVATHAHARRLVTLEPEHAQGHGLLAAALFRLGRPAEAREAMRRARELGAPTPLLSRLDGEDVLAWCIQLAWQVPLGLALFFGLGLLGSWLAGRVLSSAQLGPLQAGHVHSLNAGQTPAERTPDWRYSAVLWFASLLFYALVPALMGLMLAIGVGSFYARVHLSRIDVRSILYGLLFGGAGLIFMLRGLFVRTEAPESGRPLAPEEAPRLLHVLEEVAEVAKSRKVDRVLVKAGIGIGVHEVGGRLRVLLGRGERILLLGLGTLRGLTVSELKALLVHEYGHFSHGETRLTPTLSRTEAQVTRALQGMEQAGWSAVNPLYWYLRAYRAVYLRITAGQGRRRELLADLVAARAYGGDTFARALMKVVENEYVYERGLAVAGGLRQAGRPAEDLYRIVEAAVRGTPPVLLELVRQELLARPVEDSDSHPPLFERVEHVRGVPRRRPLENASALTLFAAPGKLAGELGAEVLQALDVTIVTFGLFAAEPMATTDEERDRLAEALALHSGALELAERDHPEARGLLLESITHLEQAAGAGDLALLNPLVKLSQFHAKHQEVDAAREVLQRALDIAQALPGHEPHVDALHQMLQELPARRAA